MVVREVDFADLAVLFIRAVVGLTATRVQDRLNWSETRIEIC